MEIKETIKEFLSQNGWKSESVEGKQEIDLRMAYQNSTSRILVDHRFNKKEFWVWMVGQNDKNCFGFEDNDNALTMVQAVNGMKDSMKAGDYFGPYLDLQNSGKVSIILWEQFKETDTSKPAFDLEGEISKAQIASAEVGAGSDLDEVVFPGKKVAKLSDYVKIMKGMQKGDMNGALQAFGLSLMDWGAVATEWGQKFASNPNLNIKLAQMMAQ
jgi:hypothetical protein